MLESQISKVLPIIYTIIGFGILILVHELGHFIFCKIFNVYTPTFSIGFGPKIIEKKIGDTKFRLSAIPLGGYVEIAGLQEIGQGEQEFAESKDETAFISKPYIKKLLILSGGVIFNLLFAYLVFIMLAFSRPPEKITIKGVEENSIAQKAGFWENDQILKINGSDSLERTLQELEKMQTSQETEVNILLSRKNSLQEIKINLPPKSTSNEEKIKIGIMFNLEPGAQTSFIDSIKRGINRTNFYIIETVKSLKNIITDRSLKGVGGPVLIMKGGINFAKKGILALLFFLAIISISLSIMNILPIPVLDGGQILFTTIEAIVGKELPIAVKNILHLLSIGLLLLLFLYITYKDIFAH